MNIRYSNRSFLYAPYVVLLVLAIAAGLRWWSVSAAFEKRLDEANHGREIAPGVTLHFGAETISGFPFNIDAVLHDVTIKVGAPRGPFVWHSDHVALHALTYGRAHEIFEAAGRQSFSWTDTEGRTQHFDFIPGSLRASAIAVDSRLARFDLDIGAAGSPEFSAARVQLHVRQAPDRNALDVFISADEVHLSPALHCVLGTEVGRLTLKANFTHLPIFLPLLAGNEAWLSAAESWRRNGGVLVVDGFEVASDKLQLHAAGKLSLDSLRRIEGAMNLHVAGGEGIAVQNDVNNRFRSALFQLTKDASANDDKPVDLSLQFQGGDTRLRRSSGAPLSAGSVDPLY